MREGMRRMPSLLLAHGMALLVSCISRFGGQSGARASLIRQENLLEEPVGFEGLPYH